MRQDEFAMMYAARFRPLNAADGPTEWRDLIASADADTMRRALDAIDDYRQRMASDAGRILPAPRIGEVRAAYRRIVEDDALERSRRAEYARDYRRPVTDDQRKAWEEGLKLLQPEEEQ